MLSDPAGLSHWHQTGRPAAENVLSPAFGLRPLAYTTDTAGYTEIVFALFDLLGLQFSPRIRDLGDQQLYRLGNIPHYRYLDTRLKGGFYLEIRPQRYRYPHCEGRPTTTQRCHWYDPNSPHTQVFEKWVWRCLVNSTVVEVSHQLGLGPDAVDGILGRWVSTTVDWNRLTTLATLGIDEMALRRGPGNYVAVISTRDAPRQVAVLVVLPDRLKATVKGLLEEGAGQSQHVVTPIVLFDPGQTVSAQS